MAARSKARNLDELVKLIRETHRSGFQDNTGSA